LSQSVTIQPVATTLSPQSEDGQAIRLGGSLVYASRFAAIVREDGKVTERYPFGVREAMQTLAPLGREAEEQWTNLAKQHAPLHLGERTIRLDQPQIMGILNVTPDSFSDGGDFDQVEEGRKHAAAMVEAGAAIIDIGGESTRPGAAPVWEGDEKDRILPAIEYCSAMGAAISIDTRRAGVLEAGLAAGAHMANDVSAMRYDDRMVGLVASSGCPIALMHAPGAGDDLHENGDYVDVVSEVFDFLKLAREKAIVSGIAQDRIVLDPGIGFGKSLKDNLALLNALPLFHALGSPILVGASRKRMIGALSNEEDADHRLGGSIALATLAMNAGAHVVRVHDVFETVQARNVWRGMRDAALTDFSALPMD